jgi:hypothetical protein
MKHDISNTHEAANLFLRIIQNCSSFFPSQTHHDISKTHEWNSFGKPFLRIIQNCSIFFGTIQRPIRLAYQPPANSTFLSEQTSHQQSASSTFLSEQISISHQPPAKRTGCKTVTSP